MRRLGVDDKQTTPRSEINRPYLPEPRTTCSILEVYMQSRRSEDQASSCVYAEYRKELAKANALDFDDLLLEAVRLLEGIRGSARLLTIAAFSHIMIDEYQDCESNLRSRADAHVGRLCHNICAVGDEDQSICSQRGDDVRNIYRVEQDFPEAKIVRLEQNYRSTQNILQAASAVVSNNLKRKGKNLWTDRRGGAKIRILRGAPDGER